MKEERFTKENEEEGLDWFKIDRAPTAFQSVMWETQLSVNVNCIITYFVTKVKSIN